LFDFL